MLRKLQRKTLVPSQMVGYALTLLVGTAIVLLTLQLYADLRPLLVGQTDIFKAHTVTVSKNVTMFKTTNKEGIYFKEKELQRLREQDFVKDIAFFGSATFNTSAAISFGGQRMSTDLFFESVPDRYVDVQSDDWLWDSTSNFLPVIIPEDYLNLYNFGFAESQSLPVVSKAMLSQVTFTVYIEGNGKRRTFDSRIVGLSGKINSILVPEDFLRWANVEFGTGTAAERRSSRLLVEFDDASDERIPAYFEANGLNINKTELESSKLSFFFRMALLFVFVIAAIIMVLSVAFIMLSMNLIMQKNKEVFVNLYNIGYSTRSIARFYRVAVGVVSAAVLLVAALLVVWVRSLYMQRLSTLFDTATSGAVIWLGAVVVALIVLPTYSVALGRMVRKTVTA